MLRAKNKSPFCVYLDDLLVIKVVIRQEDTET